jgi:hypothetical protein
MKYTGNVRFWPGLCENSKVRSATRMIFSSSVSKLNAFAMNRRLFQAIDFVRGLSLPKP